MQERGRFRGALLGLASGDALGATDIVGITREALERFERTGEARPVPRDALPQVREGQFGAWVRLALG